MNVTVYIHKVLRRALYPNRTQIDFFLEMTVTCIGLGTSGKPLIYFSLLFCTFSCFFEKSMKKYKKALFLDFFRGVKKVDHSSKITSTQKVHVIKETLTDLKRILHRQFISRIVDSASLILHIQIGYVKF